MSRTKGTKYLIDVNDEPVRVSSYPHHKLIEALSNEFRIMEYFELSSPTIPDDIGRKYYVCTRNPAIETLS